MKILEQVRHQKSGRPSKTQKPTTSHYRIEADLIPNSEAITRKAGRFILATNVLVYSLGQRALRLALAQAQQTIPNQLGQPTASPTLRWVFQCFMSVHLLTIGGIKQISNLTSERCHILQFLGSSCRKYYLLN